MTDYQAEQEMEIEALEAILMDDLERVDEKYGFNTEKQIFRITIAPKDADEDEPTEIPVRLALIFAHTDSYPDEAPLVAVRSIQGIRDTDLRQLEDKLREEVESHLGMSMMYDLAITAKEWLKGKVNPDGGDDFMTEEELKAKKDEEQDRRKREARAAGIPVTPENFALWREKFDAEIALEKAKQPEMLALLDRSKRLSGRSFFESGMQIKQGASALEEQAEQDDDGEVDLGDFDDDEDFLDDYLDGDDDDEDDEEDS